MKDEHQSAESKGLVLIVDDIVKNLQLLGKTLRDDRYKVIAVSNPNDVLKTALKYTPDLILLDVMMPGKSGFSVCGELKSNADLKHIPVIYLTAKSEKDSIVKGLKLGGADYITKPFNTAELLARVDTHITLKRSKELLKSQNCELEELISFRNKIYSVIGHDLRGPIDAMKGLSELMLENLGSTFSKDEQKTMLTHLHQSTKDIWALLSDLLNWTQVQDKRFIIKPKSFHPLDVIKKEIGLMGYMLESKDIDIVIKGDKSIELEADELILGTIFRNFLSNAIKFSKKGGAIEIYIKDHDGFELSVRDYGVGMSKEIRDKLFKQNIRRKNESKVNPKGAGIGLVLSRELARLHGGQLDVKSKIGEGAVFTLLLPKSVLKTKAA